MGEHSKPPWYSGCRDWLIVVSCTVLIIGAGIAALVVTLR
jgi:hypothetical protein